MMAAYGRQLLWGPAGIAFAHSHWHRTAGVSARGFGRLDCSPEHTNDRVGLDRQLSGRYPCRLKLKGAFAMAKVKIRPLGDKVLVKRVEAESTTAGGIVLPDAAKEKPKRGIVQALGEGRMLDSGKRVEFQVKKDDEEYLIIEENDILAIVQP
jgi:chaperonin GroES